MHTGKQEIPHLAKIVERNVNTLLHRKQEEIRNRTKLEKIIDAITAFLSSMASVYVHLLVFGVWIAWNLGAFHLPPFDADFILLATFAGVEAIFLTTFVLIGQRRINLQNDKWAELDLQVSLLTEHELTRVLNLVKAIAAKLDIDGANDKEIEELVKDIPPEKVLDTMEKATK